MEHGVEAYFIERARATRRVAAINAALSLAAFALLLLAQLPFAQRVLRRPDVMRFGFEGPTRYVQLVQIEASPGSAMPLMDVGKVNAHTTRGGGDEGALKAAAHARPRRDRRGPSTEGIGEAEEDLLARALANQGRVPIFQSDELVIETLVRPQYPEDAHNRGIEGRVAVLAHVDTLGHVVEAEVMNASGEPQLDDASKVAVLQCRFRPYRVDGAAREVYAVFRFAFRIY
jgi:TonB family protein